MTEENEIEYILSKISCHEWLEFMGFFIHWIVCLFIDDEEDLPGWKPFVEMKHQGVENPIIAQTIVFSHIHRKWHPSFKHFFIPNILISPYQFRILMYDSQNDILISSVKFPIFQDKEILDKLSIESAVFRWMVLHYKLFCVGFNVQEFLNTGEIQSNFPERAGDKLDLYMDSSLKISISSFRPVLEEALSSYDIFFGKRLLKPRWYLESNTNV